MQRNSTWINLFQYIYAIKFDHDLSSELTCPIVALGVPVPRRPDECPRKGLSASCRTIWLPGRRWHGDPVHESGHDWITTNATTSMDHQSRDCICLQVLYLDESGQKVALKLVRGLKVKIDVDAVQLPLAQCGDGVRDEGRSCLIIRRHCHHGTVIHPLTQG